jgi:predicted nucleic acid-binding protein
VNLAAPSLMRIEVANALRTYSRRGLLSEELCLEGISQLDELSLRYILEDFELIKNAYGLASRLDVTIYDAVYLSIATSADASLVTADRKLFNRLRGEENVRLLGLE